MPALLGCIWLSSVALGMQHQQRHVCWVAGTLIRLRTLKRLMLNAGQGDGKTPGAVPRADVAAVCVAAITATAADKITFELGSDKSQGAAQGPIADIFSGLKQGVYQ